MVSKDPITMSLEAFADLPDAPAGKGGQAKKVKWEDEVLPAIMRKPMTNKQVFAMIHMDKERFFFNPAEKDLNDGTVWTKLRDWVVEKKIRKVESNSGHLFYGPPVIA